MSLPRIIGLAGAARSGKDTVAGMLMGAGYGRAAFADALKQACSAIFGFSWEQLYGSEKETLDPFWKDTPRRVLQLVGTECLRRGYAEDVWVRAMERRVARDNLRWTITDVRFPNEAEAVRRWGGVVVEVVRPGAGPKGGVEGHASENALASFAFNATIHNEGTLEDLKNEVNALLRQLNANYQGR